MHRSGWSVLAQAGLIDQGLLCTSPEVLLEVHHTILSMLHIYLIGVDMQEMLELQEVQEVQEVQEMQDMQ